MPQSARFPTSPGKSKAGFVAPLPLGVLGYLGMSQESPPLYDPAKGGQSMVGANPTGVTLSAALATTYVGLCLSNPAANTADLVLTRASGLLEVAPAALTGLGLIGGWAAAGVVTHTTALTPLNGLLNGTAPTAKLDSAATIVGTPAWLQWFGVTPAATSVVSFDRKFDGEIIIPPGGYVAIGASIAGPTSGFLGSFEWLELPH